jgi:hypothetical protein
MATQIIVDTAINSAAVHVSNALHLLRLTQKANEASGEEWTAIEQAVKQLEDACKQLEGVDRVARLTGSASNSIPPESTRMRSFAGRLEAIGCNLFVKVQANAQSGNEIMIMRIMDEDTEDEVVFTGFGLSDRELAREVGILEREKANAVGSSSANTREGEPEVESEDAAAGGHRELPAVTILAGDLVDTIYGIHGICEALRRTIFTDLEEDEQSLLMGLSTLAERAQNGLGRTAGEYSRALKGIATVHG